MCMISYQGFAVVSAKVYGWDCMGLGSTHYLRINISVVV